MTLPFAAFLSLAAVASPDFCRAADPRNFTQGRLIPDQKYCDHPYVVVTKDKKWVCTMTTGPNGESGEGQHVVAVISGNQEHLGKIATRGLAFERNGELSAGETATPPRLPDLSAGGSFSVDLRVKFNDLRPGKVLLDSRDSKGKGILLATDSANELRFEINDGSHTVKWHSDPDALTTDRWHHVAIIVDGGPKMIVGVIDGRLCDGGKDRHSGHESLS